MQTNKKNMPQFKYLFLRLLNHQLLIYRIKFIQCIIFISVGCRLFAQEEFVQPPSKLITTIPFTQLTGGIIILHATLDNFKDSLNFVLDTGSGGISLDSSTCGYYKLKLVPSDPLCAA